MIYKMNNKEIRKLLIEFGSTTYGKTMFLMCYACFFIIFANMIISLFVYFNSKSFFTGSYVIVSAFISVISFTIGSYAYYKELRIYANKNKS